MKVKILVTRQQSVVVTVDADSIEAAKAAARTYDVASSPCMRETVVVSIVDSEPTAPRPATIIGQQAPNTVGPKRPEFPSIPRGTDAREEWERAMRKHRSELERLDRQRQQLLDEIINNI